MRRLQTKGWQCFAYGAKLCCTWGFSNWKRKVHWNTQKLWLNIWRIATIILKHHHLVWEANLSGCHLQSLQSCLQGIQEITLPGQPTLQGAGPRWRSRSASIRWLPATSRSPPTSSMPLKSGNKQNSSRESRKSSLLNWTRWWGPWCLTRASWRSWCVTPGRACTGCASTPSEEPNPAHSSAASDSSPQHCVMSIRKTAITHCLVDTKSKECFPMSPILICVCV